MGAIYKMSGAGVALSAKAAMAAAAAFAVAGSLAAYWILVVKKKKQEAKKDLGEVLRSVIAFLC